METIEKPLEVGEEVVIEHKLPYYNRVIRTVQEVSRFHAKIDGETFPLQKGVYRPQGMYAPRLWRPSVIEAEQIKDAELRDDLIYRLSKTKPCDFDGVPTATIQALVDLLPARPTR